MSIGMLVNASMAFAGEVVIYFDMSSVVSTRIAGTYIAPGEKLGEDAKVHGALIFTGLYSLFNSLFGFYAALRRSFRAATVFYYMTVISILTALLMTLISWFLNYLYITTILAQTPAIILAVYLCVVADSYRKSLANGGGSTPSSRSSRSGHHASGSSSGGDGHGIDVRTMDSVLDDELTVQPQDITIEDVNAASSSSSGRGGKGVSSAMAPNTTTLRAGGASTMVVDGEDLGDEPGISSSSMPPRRI